MVVNGNSKICSVGIYMPDEVVTSISLMEEINSESRFGIPHNWIDTRVGIVERRFASSETRPSELAINASIQALEAPNIKPEYIDLIIFCGIDRDYIEPSTAHVVQHKLGSRAICLDVSNACQGIISGMTLADSMIASGAVETALVCSGETASHGIKQFIKRIKEEPDSYLRDRLGMLTAGDGGSALILRRKDKPNTGIQTMLFDSRGEYAEYCYYKYENGVIEGQMLMKGITDTIAKIHLSLISNTYHYLDWKPDDVSLLACHQVGKKSHESICEMAEIPIHKSPVTYEKFGNVTTVTIPLALHIAKPNNNDKILIIGGGSGLSSYQGGIIW